MESDIVQAGGVELPHLAHGTGSEPVVLVHGYQAPARVSRLVQETLDLGAAADPLALDRFSKRSCY